MSYKIRKQIKLENFENFLTLIKKILDYLIVNE